MKKILWFINIILLVVAIALNFVSLDEDTVSVKLNTRQIESDAFISNINNDNDNNSDNDSDSNVTDNTEVDDSNLDSKKSENSSDNKDYLVDSDNDNHKEDTPVDKDNTSPIIENVVSNEDKVLEVQRGGLSAYGPDCSGCSGYLASGRYVGEDIYYNDSQYGRIRIVAGDRSYKYGTIVRIKSSKIGNDIVAIVLDRGGVGLSNKFMFDLLFKSEKEALKFGSYSDVVFEILRYGY